jgi:hypothetical protein
MNLNNYRNAPLSMQIGRTHYFLVMPYGKSPARDFSTSLFNFMLESSHITERSQNDKAIIMFIFVYFVVEKSKGKDGAQVGQARAPVPIAGGRVRSSSR